MKAEQLIYFLKAPRLLHFSRIMRWLLYLLFLPGILLAEPESFRCPICDKVVPAVRRTRNLANGQTKLICPACLAKPRCAICGLPIKARQEHPLEDGRLFCTEDFEAGLFDESAISQVLYQTKNDMDRTFWRFMKFPENNLVISVVNAQELQRIAGNAYPTNTELRGLTLTQGTVLPPDSTETANVKVMNGRKIRLEHHVYILSGLPQPRLMATCAHELGHVWLRQNLKDTRKIDDNVEEGFCELLAHQLMTALDFPLEKELIEANPYSAGQQFNLIQAEKDYGLYRIIEWMKNGVDPTLSAEDLDRIRFVDTPTAAPQVVTAPVESSAPDKLLLKGISGSGKRKVVMINNQTLEQNESGKVRVGKTNVLVRCLEIRDRSALIKVQDTGEEQELFLSPAVENKK